VFFDFDSDLLHESDRPLIEAHARYLSASRSAMVRIEGNCDERGGRNYNLALGQKRAEAVRKALHRLGVPEARMEVVSFGKQKPVDLRHHETAWATNCRVDLNYVRR
jgi:peptidoglycan-associated lipoprotein